MKKKLSLKNIEVKSFVTDVQNKEASDIKGGGDILTDYSCMRYISCFEFQCLTQERGNIC